MKPFLIGITGGSGSGKTTFIRQLQKQFDSDQLCIVSQDDYYLPREKQHTDQRGEKNFDLPKSFDKKAFRKDLEQLLSGQIVTRQEYTFNNPEAKPQTLTFRPAPIILVEGLFVFHFKKIAPLFDLKVFINAKENLKVIRRIHRDQVERNYPIEDVLYKYQYHVLPAYEQYIQPYREDADIIINNNKNFDKGLAVLIGFLKNKLPGLSE
jgi:uridine kinase